MARRHTGIRLTRLQVGLISLIVGLLGWAGLGYLTYVLPPNDSTLPAFFALFFVGVSATFAPLMLILDARFQSPGRPPNVWRSMRRGTWVGVWVTLCAWLQLIRLLDWITAILFFVILVLIEWFIISRG